jgi:SAM-dependent methyltransferase
MSERSHQDPYKQFAAHYDLFHGPFGEHGPAVITFFRALFAEHGVRRVLDCACGTGQHLPLFHSLGCDVVGSDISEAMLAQARKNLSGIELEVPLHQVDYRELSLDFTKAFDAVVCLSSSILHMPDDDQVLRAFRSMRRVLRAGGILVLTQGTSDRQWTEKPRFILATNTPGFTRLFVIDYAGRGARYNILDIWHGGDAPRQGGDLKVWSVDYPQILLRDDQERLLRKSGFREVVFYGGYGFEPYDRATSQRLIAVARK